MSQPSATLRETLRIRNAALARDCEMMGLLLSQAVIPTLLEPYRQKLVQICGYALNEAKDNLHLLRRNNDSLLEDILSKTRVADEYLRLLSSRLATPVLRGDDKDALCLKILHWMHLSHPRTQPLPFAFADGDVAVYPFIELAPIYFFPALEQGGLLYQPLHFHEFGHALYRLHKPELDALIKEIQQVVERELLPMSDRSDSHSDAQAERRELVVHRWFDWAQEFFCDAVGLTLGGPAYLYAFSAYCGSFSSSDFTLSRRDMERSKHPTHALRIQFLVRRARDAGFTEVADRIEAEWGMLARELRVALDFHGFYEDSMEDEVFSLLSDMLIEVVPRPITMQEAEPDRDPHAQDPPPLLVNRPWNVHLSDPVNYTDWEQQAIRAYLSP